MMENAHHDVVVQPRRTPMDKRTVRWTSLALCCLLLAACRDKHEPIKPTVAGPAISAATPAA
jgi:hypothetical protein